MRIERNFWLAQPIGSVSDFEMPLSFLKKQSNSCLLRFSNYSVSEF